MGLKRFIRNTARVHKLYGPQTALDLGLRTVRVKTLGRPKPIRPPKPDLPDQADLVADFLSGDEPAWLLWFDGGRYDWFEELYPEYFEGELSKCWNGGVGYTGDWSVRNLSTSFPGRGLFSNPALRNLDRVNYDGRKYFDVAPEVGAQEESAIRERLATLGYLERQENPVSIDPQGTNTTCLNHSESVTGGVVRYLKPHPPFEGLEDLTSGASKTADTMDAMIDGRLSVGELEAAYEQTYRLAFEAAADLVPELDGDVVITADHGECLDCGQLFHSRNHKRHEHLVNVPWFEVSK